MAGIPENIVVMWSGAIIDIPENWFLCNGNNGTPDLRNRFIAGAGSKYILSDTGGSEDAINPSHTHSNFATNTDGNHNHTMNSFRDGGTGRFGSRGSSAVAGSTSSSNGSHSHTVTYSNSGESGVGKNMPPYFALAYIMYGGD